MKSRTRSHVYVSAAAMILTAALAVPAAAQQRVPFKGTFQGNDAVTLGPSPTTIVVTTSGTGIGTLVGQFSFTEEVTANLANGSLTGSALWIAANGDSIYTTVGGSAAPSDNPNYLRVKENHTITGGTGRFTGAQGSFPVDRMHAFAAESDGTHLTFGSFQGTMTPPGAAR
jgi:hypothetical protein